MTLTVAGLAPTTIDAFATALTGSVIRPDETGYEAARLVWNRRFDPRPALIVRPADTRDVARTVRFAREEGMGITVRSGGHSMVGHGAQDGAILLDMGGLRSLRVDPQTRTAAAGPGLTSGEYAAAVFAHGLATPHGDAGSVGLGGLTLGGGIGYLVRKYGMSIDSLVSAELVTADGDVVHTSAEQEPELFWGIRGGGGNLGIATRFTLRLHPVDRFMGGAVVLPADPRVVSEVMRIAQEAPDGLTVLPTLMHLPPMPFFPVEHHGVLALVVLTAWTGDVQSGQRALGPIRATATPLVDLVAPMPYPAIYALTEDATQPTPSIIRSEFLNALDDAAIEGLIDGMRTPSSPTAMVQLRVLGGAMARVPAEATAFAHRAAAMMASIITTFEDVAETERHQEWSESMHRLLAARSVGVYVSFMDAEPADRLRAAYPGDTFPRLQALKRIWDPTNVFRYNQNIEP